MQARPYVHGQYVDLQRVAPPTTPSRSDVSISWQYQVSQAQLEKGFILQILALKPRCVMERTHGSKRIADLIADL